MSAGSAWAQDSAPLDAHADKAPPTSPRLFSMPVADVVGAYELALSYDGSILEEPGILASAGVVALGVGGLAQIEYRHTTAIGIRGGNAPTPAVGVQFKLPIDTGRFVPALAIAYRLGVEQVETMRDIAYHEKATDVFAVSHFALPYAIALHIGVRLTDAEIQGNSEKVQETFILPAIGVARTSGNTTAIFEVSRAPLFEVNKADQASIATGLTARLGLRWRVHPRISLDASAGYLASSLSTDSSSVLAWDIRFGGELFLSWGDLACHAASLFCTQP